MSRWIFGRLSSEWANVSSESHDCKQAIYFSLVSQKCSHQSENRKPLLSWREWMERRTLQCSKCRLPSFLSLKPILIFKTVLIHFFSLFFFSFKPNPRSWLLVTLASARTSPVLRWRCGRSWPLPCSCPTTCATSALKPAASCRTRWPSASTRTPWVSKGDASWRWQTL